MDKPNGMVHLPPILARRLIHHSTKLAKVPQHTHAEGSQCGADVGRREGVPPGREEAGTYRNAAPTNY